MPRNTKQKAQIAALAATRRVMRVHHEAPDQPFRLFVEVALATSWCHLSVSIPSRKTSSEDDDSDYRDESDVFITEFVAAKTFITTVTIST